MSSTICIATFANHIEAGWAKSLLEEQGVKAMTSSDDAGGMRPDLGFTSGGVRLFVLEENVERAMEIIRRAEDPHEEE